MSEAAIYKSSAIAFSPSDEDPVLALKMNAEAYELIVRQHSKYLQEQRTVFFHEHIPSMP